MKEVCFQNRTDQDYGFSYWSGIRLFEDAIEEYRTASVKRLKEMDPGLRYQPDEEISKDIEYFRHSATYNRIFELLDLDSNLFEKETDRLVTFTMNALVRDNDIFKMYRALESVRRQYIEKMI